MNNVPEDWNNPDFENTEKVHDWKNYASDRLKAYWDVFTPAQKMMISECLQEIADSEHWD